MLEIKNLTKIYRSKTGEAVRALDNVSVSFPESGMVFILGKSGSGKSTLLNVMGGLDSYDSGEFVIKGKSSKNFGGSDFDAYRNTFIGFIFQEYNVLDDFTVGANIGLALELQGKKATTEKINDILAKVDLLNYAKRKPNELSGGQKQRVAIARALVKEPQIIMADEPTGALDSNTGKQIFDTLKKLSSEKLVLVVSHDRDFAERYADRIIELSDGHIISDVTKHEHQSQRMSEGVDRINRNIFRIKSGYRLTASDLEMINEYLATNPSDVILSGDGRVNEELRSAAGISEKGTTSVFEETKSDADYTLKSYNKKDSRFIRSRLPMKNAVRIGGSGLKHKKFRLVMTILLSLIAFALFGFADSAAGYDKITATLESILDSDVKNASITVGVRNTYHYGEGKESRYYERALLNDDDVAFLREQTGMDFVPVYTGSRYGDGGFSLNDSMQGYASNSVYTGRMAGLVSMSEESIEKTGFSLTGRLPKAENEIVITELVYRQFNEYGLSNREYPDEAVAAGKLTMSENGSESSIIGKHVTLSSQMGGGTFIVVGVLDTKFDYNRYASLLPSDKQEGTEQQNALGEMVLLNELDSDLNYGFHTLGFVTRDAIDTMSASFVPELGMSMYGGNKEMYVAIQVPSATDENSIPTEKFEGAMNYGDRISFVAGSSALSSLNVTWVDAPRTKLLENEVVIPSRLIDNLFPQSVEKTLDPEQTEFIEQTMRTFFGQSVWEQTDVTWDYNERINQAANDEGERAMQARAELCDLYLSCYGLSVPEEFSDEAKEAARQYFTVKMEGWLGQISHENPYYVVDWSTVIDLLHILEGVRVVYENGLWENESAVSKMFPNASDYEEQWENDIAQKKKDVADFYIGTYLSSSKFGYEKNSFGKSGRDLHNDARDQLLRVSGKSLSDLLSEIEFEWMENNYETGDAYSKGMLPYVIVGYYESSEYPYSELLISDTLLQCYRTWCEENYKETGYYTERAEHADGIWSFVIAPMTADRDTLLKLVQMSYDETGDLQFCLQNSVMNTLETFNDFIEVGAKVFLYVGIGFAVFAALLLMNFIATSISYKKREIGVLRAVGARSSDVFKIFFSEALIIALINFVLSTIAVITAIFFVNNWMRSSGIQVTLLTFGVRQVILMLFVSVAVALLSSFLPVYNIARRKPIDAIRDK